MEYYVGFWAIFTILFLSAAYMAWKIVREIQKAAAGLVRDRRFRRRKAVLANQNWYEVHQCGANCRRPPYHSCSTCDDEIFATYDEAISWLKRTIDQATIGNGAWKHDSNPTGGGAYGNGLLSVGRLFDSAGTFTNVEIRYCTHVDAGVPSVPDPTYLLGQLVQEVRDLRSGY